jgi:hypothetical protein
MFILEAIQAIYQSLLRQVREINRKYAQPEIEMTPFIRFCLIGLRVYLLFLVGLMILKFILAARGSSAAVPSAPEHP